MDKAWQYLLRACIPVLLSHICAVFIIFILPTIMKNQEPLMNLFTFDIGS